MKKEDYRDCCKQVKELTDAARPATREEMRASGQSSSKAMKSQKKSPHFPNRY